MNRFDCDLYTEVDWKNVLFQTALHQHVETLCIYQTLFLKPYCQHQPILTLTRQLQHVPGL